MSATECEHVYTFNIYPNVCVRVWLSEQNSVCKVPGWFALRLQSCHQTTLCVQDKCEIYLELRSHISFYSGSAATAATIRTVFSLDLFQRSHTESAYTKKKEKAAVTTWFHNFVTPVLYLCSDINLIMSMWLHVAGQR